MRPFFFCLFYRKQKKQSFFYETLSTDIECGYVYTKYLFEVFSYFEMCFSLVKGEYAPKIKIKSEFQNYDIFFHSYNHVKMGLAVSISSSSRSNSIRLPYP